MSRAVLLGLIILAIGGRCLAVGIDRGGWWLWEIWPAANAFILAAAYFWLGPAVLGKRPDGTLPWIRVIVLLPYFLASWGLQSLARRFGRSDPWNEVVPGLYLGRRPIAGDLPDDVTLIVDLTAEFFKARGLGEGCDYVTVPSLDFTAPPETGFRMILDILADWPDPVFIHCAKGHGRSAALVAAVLIRRGLAADLATATEQIRTERPGIWINGDQRSVVRRVCGG